MAKSYFSAIDIAIALFSLLTYVVDIGTDIAAGVQYFLDGKELLGWLTTAFVFVPAVVMSVFSLTWHMHDKTVNPLIVILHILPLAPVQRYARVVRLGLVSRKTKKVVHTQRALRAQNDVSILRLIEAFMESAPQLVLQVYVMITSQQVYWLSGLVAGSSLLSLAWAMTAYSDSLRKAHVSRYQQRLPRLFWHFGWQLFMVTSRIAAFVFLASVINQWLFAVMGGHWLMAFIWITFKGTDFGSDFCEKWLFRMVCAFIYIFVFMNLNDGVSRWRISAFYVVLFVENAAMASVYLVSGQGGNLITVSCVTIFGGFILGLLCMLIYYGFFHPSGPRIKIAKAFQPKSRMFSVSQTSVMFSPGGGVQVFSLETTPPSASVGGTGSYAKSEAGASQVSAAVKGRSWDPNLSSHRHSHVIASSGSSQQDLQRAWQNGIDSSSSDSSDTNSLSSLASDIALKNDKDEVRPPSRNSNNSDNSATSDNCLLPPLTRNDLSKSSETSAKFPVKESILIRKNFSGEVSGSDSVNIQSSTESPTLSRGSWARSSDYKSSHGVEDFVTLAFDDSSSTDRRGSDASSHASRPKSLSPLDVASLWQDVHGKLRQTIAATIAAATGSISSNEGTSNHSRSSVSQNTTISSQDENQSSFSQNSAILDAPHSRSNRNDISLMQNGSINGGKQREAMCSLPDILEAVETEQISDVSGSETSYSNSASQRRVYSEQPAGARNRWSSPGFVVDENKAVDEIHSPYPEDSTLTASKLLTGGAKSYIHYTQSSHKRPGQETSFTEAQNETNQNVQGEEFSQDWAKGMQTDKGHSPFTDQELVTVMANSLQSYMGYSTPATSISREREGLALTIDDLRFSPDSTTDAGGNVVRTRSTSSLFHDSNNSSPASSASKMQRQTEANKEAEKLSPNALKVIDHYPWRRSVDIHGITNSQALSILREAYAHSLAISPRNQSYLSSAHSRKNMGDGHPARFETPNEGMRRRRDIRLRDQNVCPKLEVPTSAARQASERYCGEDSPYQLEGDFVLFDSIAWQKAKLMAKKSKRANYVHGQGRQSSSKKLSMHGTSFQLEDYSSSPSRPGHTLEVSATNGDPEEYVKGKYCPPLCELPENVPKNLNLHRRSSLDMGSRWKHVLAHTDAKNLSDEDNIGYLRSEIIRQDRRRSQQESDFFNLHFENPDNRNRKKISSISQPNLRRKSQSLSPRKKGREAEKCISEGSRLKSPSQSKSYICTRRSPSHNSSFDQSSLGSLTDQELETSARNVVDYFSQAIDSQYQRFSYDPTRHRRRNFSNTDLGVHSSRPPLRPLQNTSHSDQ